MHRLRFVVVAAGALTLVAHPACPLAAQTAAIRGVVTDSATRRPLQGALVMLIETNQRVSTNANGEYRLADVSPGSHTVRVQMIGFMPVQQPVEVAAGAEVSLDFALRLQSIELEQVVVIGYGTQTRENLSTAVTSISARDLTGQAVASPDAALQGKATGVFVSQNAGNPGNAITVRVRGSASLNANSQPLYVVDGVPVVSEDMSQIGKGGQGLRAASGLNPEDIESIDVLKDAASASIYGTRGSNGVVLITTKRGSSGRPVVSFNAYGGQQSVPKRLDLLNATEYITYFNEAAENDGYGADYFGPVGVADSINTDWQREIFRTAPIGSAELAVAGGTDQIRYRVAGNYFEQRGVVLASNYRRLGGRVNLDFRASDRLNFATNLALSGEDFLRVESDNSLDGVVGNAIANQPYLPARLPGGFSSTADGLSYTNSLALAAFNDTRASASTILGSVEARWQVASDLTATGRVGVNLYNIRETEYQSPKIVGQYAAGVGGVAIRGFSLANKYVFDGFLTWSRTLGARHALQVTGGTSLEHNPSDAEFIRGETLSDETLHEVSNATTITQFSGAPSLNNLVSFFGRANYTLDDKYLFGASFRTDGASFFAPNHKYANFPGFSAAWVVSREPFLASSGTVGFLKLRASYGYTGNTANQDYPFQSKNSTANYGGEPGYYSSTIGNPNLTWERTRQIDVGMDVELFHSRASLTADWYHKKTTDLLVDLPIAGNSGYTVFPTNVGNMENRGVELSLSTVNLQPLQADGLRWTTSLNVSANRNRVTKLYNGQPFSTGLRLINRVQVGEPIGAFYAFKFLGVDPTTGDAIYEDVDGDGSITNADQTIVGSPWPDFSGGFTSTLTWRGFDLNAFFQFSQGNQIFNGMKIFSLSGGYYYDNEFRDALKRWRQPGDQTDEPRASFDGLSGARVVSSRYIEDGSYLRLQELTLGYQLPTALTRRLGFASTRVYLRGLNLFTRTKYTGYNPDVNSNGSTANISLGTDFYAYPLARTFSFGIQAGW
jgi:TonB-linked SusC/RagA family outer membrane protein